LSAAEEYDLVVLRSGAPGTLVARTLASQGKRLAVIERRYVGGSCPNIACLPSKNVIHKDVWAVGDCAGSPYFTHIGVDDFRVVLTNLSG
jgi:pyruvate/2-oxoglutarate dehydrogenase complex dihydrolipoamide dehydrogenase (E3) component